MINWPAQPAWRCSRQKQCHLPSKGATTIYQPNAQKQAQSLHLWRRMRANNSSNLQRRTLGFGCCGHTLTSFSSKSSPKRQQLSKSNSTHVYLRQTSLASEGTYKCEVSADSPSFATLSVERQMKVYGEFSTLFLEEKPPPLFENAHPNP